METVTEKKYVCEYCRSTYTSMRAALECQANCKERYSQWQKWYDKHKPKYKEGDFVYTQHRSFPYKVVGCQRCMGKVSPSYCYKIVAGECQAPFQKQQEDLSLCMSKQTFQSCCEKIQKGLPEGSQYTIWPAARRMTQSTQDRVLNIRLYLPRK